MGSIDDILIANCECVGPYVPRRNRPLYVVFQWQGDKEKLTSNQYQLPHGVYVHDDYPEEINHRRLQLRPIMKATKEDGHKAKLEEDKLVIDSEPYRLSPKNNLHELPDKLHYTALNEKSNDETIAFFGINHPLSNFHPAEIKKDGLTYNCSEQYIQYKKAMLFGDHNMAEEILTAKLPTDIKKLEGRIRIFDKNKWSDNCHQIAYEASLAKYNQNPECLSYLLNTKSKMIIEERVNTGLWGQ